MAQRNLVSRTDANPPVPTRITHATFSADGCTLVTVEVAPKLDPESAEAAALKFWSWNHAERRFVLNTRAEAPHEGGVTACEFHPAAAMAVTAGRDGTFKLWERQTLAPVISVAAVAAIAAGAGSAAADDSDDSMDDDDDDDDAGNRKLRRAAKAAAVTAAAASAAASASEGRASGTTAAKAAHRAAASASSASSAAAAAAAARGNTVVWACKSAGFYRDFEANAAAFSADGSALAIAFSHHVTLWDWRDNSLYRTLTHARDGASASSGSSDTDAVRDIAFCGLSPALVSATASSVIVWDLLSATPRWRYDGLGHLMSLSVDRIGLTTSSRFAIVVSPSAPPASAGSGTAAVGLAQLSKTKRRAAQAAAAAEALHALPPPTVILFDAASQSALPLAVWRLPVSPLAPHVLYALAQGQQQRGSSSGGAVDSAASALQRANASALALAARNGTGVIEPYAVLFVHHQAPPSVQPGGGARETAAAAAVAPSGGHDVLVIGPSNETFRFTCPPAAAAAATAVTLNKGAASASLPAAAAAAGRARVNLPTAAASSSHLFSSTAVTSTSLHRARNSSSGAGAAPTVREAAAASRVDGAFRSMLGSMGPVGALGGNTRDVFSALMSSLLQPQPQQQAVSVATTTALYDVSSSGTGGAAVAVAGSAGNDEDEQGDDGDWGWARNFGGVDDSSSSMFTSAPPGSSSNSSGGGGGGKNDGSVEGGVPSAFYALFAPLHAGAATSASAVAAPAAVPAASVTRQPTVKDRGRDANKKPRAPNGGVDATAAAAAAAATQNRKTKRLARTLTEGTAPVNAAAADPTAATTTATAAPMTAAMTAGSENAPRRKSSMTPMAAGAQIKRTGSNSSAGTDASLCSAVSAASSSKSFTAATEVTAGRVTRSRSVSVSSAHTSEDENDDGSSSVGSRAAEQLDARTPAGGGLGSGAVNSRGAALRRTPSEDAAGAPAAAHGLVPPQHLQPRKLRGESPVAASTPPLPAKSSARAVASTARRTPSDAVVAARASRSASTASSTGGEGGAFVSARSTPTGGAGDAGLLLLPLPLPLLLHT